MNRIRSIVFILGIIISAKAISQEKQTLEISFMVYGKCDMCETRIKNALDVKGIKFAEWDLSTKICKVIYRSDKITEEKIHNLISQAGHDTEKKKSSEKAYQSLHHCCKYKRK